MGIFDALTKIKNDEKKAVATPDHNSLISLKAKALIEELVSPLSKPNQKIIDEVLTIITQTSKLPDSMVNKEEVQKITKKLLFELVEPISNPDKQLIDELVQLINLSGSRKENPKIDSSVSDNSTDNDVENPDKSNLTQGGVSSTQDRLIKGHAGIKQRQLQASAQAQFPSEVQQQSKAKDRETKSIMNLLLEQIKELITITNGLNSKLKSHQVRLDSFDSSIQEIKRKSQDFDERMVAFEKNMEKFIGLYEVVTNQYNPFVETNKAFLNDEQSHEKEVEKEIKPKILEIEGNKILHLDDLSDALIFVSDDDFDEKIKSREEEIFTWLEDVIKNPGLKEELSSLKTRKEWIKAIIKEQHK